MITIDSTKCTGCGFCSDECPAGVLIMGLTPDGSHKAQVRFIQDCTVCGHCVALCPTDAIAHGGLGLPVEGFTDRLPSTITPNVMREFLMSRRSIRAFKQKPVPRELIEKLIEAGTHAGTASNAQTEGFVIVQDEKFLSQLENTVIEVLWSRLKPLGNALGRTLARIKFGENTMAQSLRYYERFKARRADGALKGTVFRNAPVVIAVHGNRSNLSVHENCAIAVRNMEIVAQSMGLGTCWAGLLLVAAGFTKKIAGSLGISDDRNIYSAIMLGYPKHEYRKTIPRKQREISWL